MNDAALPPITPKQMWAARLLVGWSRERLASRAETTAGFVRAYEDEGRIIKMLSRERSFDGLASIRSVLEADGIEFIQKNGGGVGVELRKANGALLKASE